MDSLTPEKRSWNMSRITYKNTKPEKSVRSLLHGMGYRFRLHRRDLPGCPDIVLPHYKTVIFVNGCFWHRHENCKYAYHPKSRVEFWEQKFLETVDRDKKNYSLLRKQEWDVLVIWECELTNMEKLAGKIEKKLK